MSTIDNLLQSIPIPRMIKVRQSFPRPVINDVTEVLETQLREKQVLSSLKQGESVAIAVGSRGISNLPLMVKTLVRAIKQAGGMPFIVPAMGSHGGATAEGQKKMLIGLGFREDYIDAPIRSTMDVIEIGQSDNGLPVYLDKYAYSSDYVVVINRIKPHVAFRGSYESGLMKMIAIGLGKQKGADICHDLGFGKMAENIPAIAKVALTKTNFLFGVGIIENAFHETCKIQVLQKNEIAEVEPLLQEEAKQLSPKLYLKSLDVLIIDEIGKDISGTGFDTNVVGRYHTPYITGGPNITRVAVLDITNVSHGNANGLGIVDFTTKRAFDKFDFEQTYPNALTSTVPMSVKIPMVLKNDRQAIQAAIKTSNILNKTHVRMVRIKNTISLGEIEVSENLTVEVHADECMELVGLPYTLEFDQNGNLF